MTYRKTGSEVRTRGLETGRTTETPAARLFERCRQDRRDMILRGSRVMDRVVRDLAKMRREGKGPMSKDTASQALGDIAICSDNATARRLALKALERHRERELIMQVRDTTEYENTRIAAIKLVGTL